MVYNEDERRKILNIFDYFRIDQRCSLTQAMKRTAVSASCSKALVARILQERAKGPIRTPRKTHDYQFSRKYRWEGFVQSAIRSLIHSWFFQNSQPSLKTILTAVNNNPDLPNFSRSGLYKYIYEAGFCYKEVEKKRVLVEKDDVIAERHQYLREMMRLRAENRPIVYLGETHICSEYIKAHEACTITDIKSGMDAFKCGVRSGKNVPMKDRRHVLFHAGNEDGFVENALEVVICDKASPARLKEVDVAMFEQWFCNNLLPNLKGGTIIVMDYASYRCRSAETRDSYDPDQVSSDTFPSSSWNRSQILEWLQEKGIVAVSDSLLKSELVTLAKKIAYVPPEKFACDKMARDRGFKVVRLPPYHHELNPIQLIWAHVKHNVARSNCDCNSMKNKIREAISTVTPDHWKSYIAKVLIDEEIMWKIDYFMEEIDTGSRNYGDDYKQDTDSELDESIPGPSRDVKPDIASVLDCEIKD